MTAQSSLSLPWAVVEQVPQMFHRPRLLLHLLRRRLLLTLLPPRLLHSLPCRHFPTPLLRLQLLEMVAMVREEKGARAARGLLQAQPSQPVQQRPIVLRLLKPPQ